MQNSWGIGFLFLLVLAAVMALVTIYLTQKQSHLPYTTQQRRTLVYASAKILLVLSAFLTLYFFIKGTALKLDPVNSARYLICLWLSLPVALWPLWPGNSSIFYQSIVWQRLFVLAKCAVLLLVLSGFAMSTFNIFHSALPVAQRINQQQQNLISSMRQQHITHFYTDYWTCYNIAVLTQEKMICATVNDSLDLVGNRYKPYMFAVQDANYPAYVFKKGSKTITLLEQRFQKEHTAFTRTETETYVILRVGRGEAGR